MSSEEHIKVSVDVEDVVEGIEKLSELKDTFAEAKEGANLFETAITALKNPLLAIPAAIGLAVGAIYELGEAGAQAAEKLAKISETSVMLGISAEKFQELNAIAMESGVSTETVQAAFARFNHELGDSINNVNSLTTVFRQLGLDPITESAKRSDVAFMDLITGLHNLSSAAQQANLSYQAFGRQGGLQMLGIARQSTEEIEKMVEKAREMGDIIPEEVIERGRQYVDQIKLIRTASDAWAAENKLSFTALGVLWDELTLKVNKFLAAMTNPSALFQNSISGKSIDQLKQLKEQLESQQQAANDAAFAGGYATTNDYQGQIKAIDEAIEKSNKDTLKELQENVENYHEAVMAGESRMLDQQEKLADERLAVLDKNLEAQFAANEDYFAQEKIIQEDATNAFAESMRVRGQAIEALNKDIDEWKEKLMEGTAATDGISKTIQQIQNDDRGLNFLSTWDTALYDFSGVVKRHSEDWKQDFNQVWDSMTNGIVNFVTTGKFSFKSFTAEILTDLAKIATEKALAGIFTSVLGAIGGPTVPGFADSAATSTLSDFSSNFSLGSITSARGNVLSMFATGGLTAGYSQVGNSVMGERNTEAVLPLTRDKNGNLGVNTTGGSGGDTIVYNTTIQIQSNSQDPDVQGQKAAEAFTRNIAKDEIAKAKRPGNMLYTRG